MRVSPSVAVAVCGLVSVMVTLTMRAQERVDFERQIQPILEQACYECHGPSKSRGKLRLHDGALALNGGASGPVIVPGHAADSILVQRILGQGDDDRMPLEKAPLSAEQIALITAWIDQGANWPGAAQTSTSTSGGTPAPQTASAGSATSASPSSTPATAAAAAGAANPGAGAPAGSPVGSAAPHADAAAADAHWAYVKPRRPSVPAATPAPWVRNPIDAFILARLNKEGIEPSGDAPKTTLLRRATLDLIGLPPTPQEIDAFLADTRPDAYERVVDRLLASPHYGEREARPWLDLARYADTNGFDKDNQRQAWAYRDWVIDAFNADMPFDQFTIEQIAGDMLPDATPAQKIATGFHRNTMTNIEGGVDPEEARYEMLVDRVNTTGTVWLGSTIACAQCHNHKYDPFSQKDYYRLMAFFESSAYTRKSAGSDGTHFVEDTLDLATPEQRQRRAAIEKDIATYEAALKKTTPALALAQAEWERGLRQAHARWTPLTPTSAKATGGAELTVNPDASISARGANPELTTYTIEVTAPMAGVTALRIEALPDPELPSGGPGRDPYGHFRMTGLSADVAPAGAPAGARAARASRPVVFRSIRVDDSVGKIQPEALLGRLPRLGELKDAAWTINAMRDETRLPRQAVLILDRPTTFVGGARFTIRLDFLEGTIGQGLGRFRVSATTLAKPETIVSIPAKLRPVLAIPAAQRTKPQADDLAAQFRGTTPRLTRQRDALTAARKALEEMRLPTAMVLRETPTFERPSTYLRQRGAFTSKGALTYAGLPSVLPRMPDSQPVNRLGLAHWLVDESNPLVARVAVNRLWEQVFGRGIVETSEDFGTQGAAPSHPDLLDWLATEFVARKWSQKAMLRLMVTSATYRQHSDIAPALLARDPYNRLLARGPRFRLEAEMIRDVVLGSSGLLSAKLHGPSVFPPQPDGIWNVAANSETWKTSEGEDRYRRGIYTFLRRTAPYPTMTALDATSREYCTVRRVRTDTPLQALALLNDEAYFEAARALALRLLQDDAAGQTVDARLTYGVRLVTARMPDERELARLRAFIARETAYYTAHVDEARLVLTDRPAAISDALDSVSAAADAASSTPAAPAQAASPTRRGAGAARRQAALASASASASSADGAQVREKRAAGAAAAGAAVIAVAPAPPALSDREAVERAVWTLTANVLLNLDEVLTKD